MKRRVLFPLTAAIALLQTGCVNVSFRDAISAGVFDFVSGAVGAILSTVITVPGA